MAGAQSQHRTGIVLIVAAAVAWSTAPFFTRLLPLDSWTILFWRGLFGGSAIAAMLVLMQGRAGLRNLAGMGKIGWLVASLSTLGMVCFIPALQLTSVSNVAVIIATGPFVAAAMAWIWLRETVHLRTLLASLVALCGVVIIVGDISASADILGIALACLMTFAIAAMTVVVRQHRNTPMVAAAALSNLLGSLVSVPFAHGIAGVTGTDLIVLALFGFPGRDRPLAVHARLPPAAIRTSNLDRHPGNAADAVVGVAGVPGGSWSTDACRGRAGDGSCHCRHHRRYQGAATNRRWTKSAKVKPDVDLAELPSAAPARLIRS